MKNRPVVSQPNQYQDVYGSQKSSTRTTITAVLIVLMAILTVIAAINQSQLLIMMFGVPLVGLIIALFVGRRADKYNMPPKTSDSPDAIFKEHEE